MADIEEVCFCSQAGGGRTMGQIGMWLSGGAGQLWCDS